MNRNIIPLHKKDDKNEYKNYRGVVLLNTKLFSIVLEKVIGDSNINCIGTEKNKSHECLANTYDFTILSKIKGEVKIKIDGNQKTRAAKNQMITGSRCEFGRESDN